MSNKSSSGAPTKQNGRKGYASKRSDYKPRHKSSGKPGAKSGARDYAERSGAGRKPAAKQNPRFHEREYEAVQKPRREPVVKQEKFESEIVSESFMTFQEMELPEKVTQELAKMGAVSPFPIQAATIPAAISGMHVLGRGKTGSGKTIAFGVPLVVKLQKGGNQPRVPNKPRALILAPTRELAEQINNTLAPLAKSVGFFTTTIYGGVSQFKQERALERGVDIAIATPGRLEDLIRQGLVDLSGCEQVVVDEAD
ncbi:MAG: DEAD/DEAH box helicase, partial [Aquiluna sp.]